MADEKKPTRKLVRLTSETQAMVAVDEMLLALKPDESQRVLARANAKWHMAEAQVRIVPQREREEGS